MGQLGDLLKMIPGFSKAMIPDNAIDENKIRQVEAIICSMTRGERANPQILNGSRRKRIAVGSGTKVSDVNALVKSFEEARKTFKQFGGGKRLPPALRKVQQQQPWSG
jgi:signal recognition particle subunit SRP54